MRSFFARFSIAFIQTVLLIFALVSLVIAVYWVVSSPSNERAEPLLTTIGLLSSGLSSLLGLILGRVERNQAPAADPHLRHRQAMIKQVQYQVHDLLEQSIHEAAWIELKTEPAPQQVAARPWRMSRMPERTEETRLLDSDIKIYELFEQAGELLLIMGAPGSGKTTTMLDLAQWLLDEAAEDEKKPIPVYLNLSSWSGETLEAWLAAQLKRIYDVPVKLGQTFIERDELLLLLDGLDEVVEDKRKACAEEINAYRQGEHSLGRMAVCCRITDYEAIGVKLSLNDAIVIQPLTDTQIS